MSRTRTVAAALAALLLSTAASPAVAQEAGEISYETYELDNGLQVILHQDRSTPVAAVDVWYDVGARDEERGRSGFAHLFEHMMFQGSENVEKAQHLTMVESVGGSVNGSTTEDRTNYFETVPANRVNLALWLEADRMRSLAVTEENLENQRETVKEERRLRVDNQPYGKSFLRFTTMPYDSATCFGYAHSVIGSMEDLNAASVEDVQSFFDTYYAPNNATLVVSGDFETEQVKELIRGYFGGIERSEPPAEVECEVDYDTGIQVDTIMDQNANLPAIFWSYRVPPHEHPDSYALQLVSRLFGQGESSRLHQELVKETGAAAQVNAFLSSRRGPGLFAGFAIANQGVPADSLLGLVQSEVRRLAEDPPTTEELEKAKNDYEASEIQGRQRVLQKAEELQHFAHFHDDLADINSALDRYLAVEREDLRRVVEEYLTPDNLSVVVTLPASGSDEGTEQEGSDR
jgi:predicted Zn-dependent peptidase